MNFKKIMPFFGAILFLFAGWALHKELSAVTAQTLKEAIHAIPPYAIVLALLAVVLNYSILTLNDTLGLRYIGAHLDYQHVAFASFIGNAIGFNLGMAALSGGSIRYRLYSAYGLQAFKIALLVSFCQLSFVLGIWTLTGAALLLEPQRIISSLGWNPLFQKILSVSALAVPISIFILGLRQRSFRLFSHTITLPSSQTLCAQCAVAVADLVSASAVLFLLLPKGQLSFFAFSGAYTLAIIAGSASQVPGGLGVFDITLISLLSSFYPKAELLGALLVFRLAYYLLPLILASLLLAYFEVSSQIKMHLKTLTDMLPLGISLLVFFIGASMLFSGSIPVYPKDFVYIAHFVPTPLIEISSFLNSILGTVLLFVAWGLSRRLRSAWILGAGILGMGIFSSLISSFSYVSALLSLLLLLVMLCSRKKFYRLSHFSATHLLKPFSEFSFSDLKWVLGILCVLLSTLWLGFFTYRNVSYSNELWWKFELSSQAPQFLRAALGMSMLSLFIFGHMWLKPARSISTRHIAPDALKKLVTHSDHCSAALAFLGDKKFFTPFNDKCAIMYSESGPFRIAMGDPIGDETAAQDLICRFAKEADQENAKAAFYEVSEKWTATYRSAGFQIIPLGEEASVNLKNVPDDLSGSQWKDFRATRRHMQTQNCTFRILEEQEKAATIPLLRQISDEWLQLKHGKEKGFSLGFFDESYLAHFPIAVTEQEGRIMAFSNLWLSPLGKEFSVDLMRHALQSPRDIMSYLFIECMLWGKQQGYDYFKLGMAPLSGMNPEHSIWEKLGQSVYQHGGHFYNFQGLRAYKEKFHPEWKPSYLAYKELHDLPLLLSHLVHLISQKRTEQNANDL